ncbi:MAG: hypothetical protein K6G44_05485 [Lentisphaeria bacterium]|nr:hypothetical protein [Lentisphaeria bacterium]
MLLSEEEQKATGYDRQRKMYPLGSRQRLSAAALKDGSDFLKKKELAKAMEEFNRAWRFDPTTPYVYWMAAIVRSMEGKDLKDSVLRKKCFEDGLKLFEMASKLIPVSEKHLKENLVLDKAETLIQYGLFLKKDNPEQAGKMFQQAEVLLKDFAPGEDERGKQIGERINDMRSRIKEAR